MYYIIYFIIFALRNNFFSSFVFFKASLGRLFYGVEIPDDCFLNARGESPVTLLKKLLK